MFICVVFVNKTPLTPVCRRQQVRPCRKQTGEPHLGVPEAARPLCMNTILQDALTYVVQRFSQPSFPVNSKESRNEE